MNTGALICYGVCLLANFYTLQKFIASKSYSYTHRLMGLTFGLICVYDFYKIIGIISGQREVFSILEILILINGLYVIMYYTADIHHLEMKPWMPWVIFSTIIVANLYVIGHYMKGEPYLWRGRIISVLICVLILIVEICGIRSKANSVFNKKTHLLLAVSLMLPETALVLYWLGVVGETYSVPVALTISCLIFDYMIDHNLLYDVDLTLQESLYLTSSVPMVLLDEEKCFIGANVAARQLDPESFETFSNAKGRDRYVAFSDFILESEGQHVEIMYGDIPYDCKCITVDKNGITAGYAIIYFDVSHQKHETEMMKQLKELADQRTQAKSVFLANLSHDLRSPIHAIIGLCDVLMSKRAVSPAYIRLVSGIKSSGSQLLYLVNDILNFSKIESDRFELREEPYSMRELIYEVSNITIANLLEKPTDFRAKVLTAFPERVVGDEMRVREILQNVLSNAAKYTQRGFIELRISCRTKDGEAFFECEIEDSGPGIEEDKLESIFRSYETIEETRHEESLGLGLCIVRQLTQRMGGAARAESVKGVGSTLFVSFRQAVEGEMMVSPFEYSSSSYMERFEHAEDRTKPGAAYPKARVLVVDDMDINREIFNTLTEPWGFKLDEADDGDAAVRMATENRYDLIFMDLRLPTLDGTEATRRIHEKYDTPVILLTANMEKEMAEKYREEGFAGFLGKPYTLSDLKRCIENNLPGEMAEPYVDNTDAVVYAAASSSGVSIRTLENYINEMESLRIELPKLYSEDLSMYRTKIHGVKGASKQMGYMDLGERAEILEMAAKTENRRFIEDHLNTFDNFFRETIEKAKTRLYRLKMSKRDEKSVDEAGEKYEEEQIRLLFKSLSEGFDNYDLGRIEQALDSLEKAAEAGYVEERLRDELVKLRKACAEFEYEEGALLAGSITV